MTEGMNLARALTTASNHDPCDHPSLRAGSRCQSIRSVFSRRTRPAERVHTAFVCGVGGGVRALCMYIADVCGSLHIYKRPWTSVKVAET